MSWYQTTSYQIIPPRDPQGRPVDVSRWEVSTDSIVDSNLVAIRCDLLPMDDGTIFGDYWMHFTVEEARELIAGLERAIEGYWKSGTAE